MDPEPITYWNAVYFLMVTMSTVGYGDITCLTEVGRVFQLMFLAVGLMLFAGVLPEILALLGQRSKWMGSYSGVKGKRHIVVCGNITFESVSVFLMDFLHEDRDDVDVEVVFLHRAEPDLEFEGLLKRQHTRVKYFQGSLMNGHAHGYAHHGYYGKRSADAEPAADAYYGHSAYGYG